MIKIFLIIILVLVLFCFIMFAIVKYQISKNKKLQKKIADYESECNNLNIRVEKLMEEMEIEKKHNKELAKKLADISCMSIDDVLSQLQND